jgi:hypothetical protein
VSCGSHSPAESFSENSTSKKELAVRTMIRPNVVIIHLKKALRFDDNDKGFPAQAPDAIKL